MFFISLLCFALFSNAFGNELLAESHEDDSFFTQADAAFATKFPLPYKVLNSIRIMLGIPKIKMMKFAMKLLEIVMEFQELWEVVVEMFRKDTPKARISTAKPQYSNNYPHNTQFYYGY